MTNIQRSEKPILFNDEMVRAILEGRKTQTRRIVKGIDHDLIDMMCWDLETEAPNSEFLELLYGASTDDDGKRVRDQWLVRCTECPEEGVLTMGQGYGQLGDRLWVREAHAFVPEPAYRRSSGIYQQINPSDDYEACVYRENFDRARSFPWRSSIHMPRWASRITLEITNVRVERLQDISETDAISEGAQEFKSLPSTHPYGQDNRWSMESPTSTSQCLGNARMAFANYFCKISGKAKKGLIDFAVWDSNPWVWVIEFKAVEQEGGA